jgi:nicotinamidase-related amidase
MNDPLKLRREQSLLLLIDVQARLLPHIHDAAQVVAASSALLEGTAIFDVPALVTVQYVRGLGAMPDGLTERCTSRGLDVLEKMSFSVCADATCLGRWKSMGRRQVIVAGIEAHVCVQQTVLDLLGDGAEVFVCADAVSSRRVSDRRYAFHRMRQAGAVITTTESVLFELCGVAGSDEFRLLRDLIKRFDADRKQAESPGGGH